jgi:hypothetical protein
MTDGMMRWKFGGTMGDNATDEMKRLSVVEVEASRIQSSLLYVTRLLTAMRSHAIASNLEKKPFFHDCPSS